LVLIGLLVFDDRNRYDMLIGIAMVLVGVFNVIVSCMRKDIDQKEWEEQARQGLEYDDPYGSEEEDAGRKIYKRKVPMSGGAPHEVVYSPKSEDKLKK
jgi:hypothetical protein